MTNKTKLWIDTEFSKPNNSYRQFKTVESFVNFCKHNKHIKLEEISLGTVAMFNESDLVNILIRYNIHTDILFLRANKNHVEAIASVKKHMPNTHIRTKAYGKEIKRH